MTVTPVSVRPRTAALFMGSWLALLWLLELVDTVALHALDAWGITPRVWSELPQVFTAPFLHFGFAHLAANSLPFFLLGLLTLLAGVRTFGVVTLASVVGSGLLVWVLAAPRSLTAGASGLVFGWLTYLLVRGFFARDVTQLVIAAVVFLVYGGVLWGVLPIQAGISWQAHLGGAIGGAWAAWWLRDSRPRGSRRQALDRT